MRIEKSPYSEIKKARTRLKLLLEVKGLSEAGRRDSTEGMS
jgi:hypothetical protein